MKKKLNTEGIANELAGASLFFAPSNRAEKKSVADTPLPEKPVIQEEREKQKDTPYPPYGVPPVRDVRPVLPVPPTKKRVMKQRHPFDIYQDQYEELQRLALEERKQGGIGSMSAMVREAIDRLIAERRPK
jgi:hypothetical protein